MDNQKLINELTSYLWDMTEETTAEEVAQKLTKVIEQLRNGEYEK